MVRIAIIDDDQSILDLARDILALRDWQALLIRESDTAVTRVCEQQPDLVILDVRLDLTVSGWSILQQLKEEPRTRHIPVVMWTGSGKIDDDKTGWLAANGIPVVAKPFDLDELFETIDAALAGNNVTAAP